MLSPWEHILPETSRNIYTMNILFIIYDALKSKGNNDQVCKLNLKLFRRQIDEYSIMMKEGWLAKLAYGRYSPKRYPYKISKAFSYPCS